MSTPSVLRFFATIAALLFYTPFLSAIGQEKLVITRVYCEAEDDNPSYNSEIHFFKKEKEQLLEIGYYQLIQTDSLVLENLAAGDYTVYFPNTMNAICRVEFEVRKNGVNRISICEDMRPNHTPPLPQLSRLEKGESYQLTIKSQGCYHQATDTILIERTDTHYYLTYQQKRVTLSRQAIDYIKAFEFELMTFETTMSCTTRSVYLFIYKNEMYTYSDHSCHMPSHKKLLQKLGLIEDPQ